MEIILKILTLIMFIGILYNSKQRKSMMNGYAFSYNELKGCFTLNDKFEITNLIYNDVDLLHQGVFAL